MEAREKTLRSRFQSNISADAKIRLFLKSSKVCQETSLVSQIDAGEPSSCVLEEYFDRCIEIKPDNAKPQNDSEEEECRLKLNLDFDIFTDNFMETTDNTDETSSAPERSMANSYWFLKLLASKPSLQPLCKHPYITAFLDLHYSTVKNARKQMVDSIPHLALMLVLGHLASTMPGHLHDNFENLIILATLPFGTFMFLDIVSHVGEKTEIVNRWLNRSLCSPKKKITSCSERLINIYSTGLYLIGYFISISSLVGGCYYHFYQKNTKDIQSEEYICSTDDDLVPWRLILEYTLVAYPILLLVLEVFQMNLAENLWNDYFGHSKNWIDLAEIVSTLSIAIASFIHRDICTYSWMQNLIYLMMLVTFFQLVNDLVHCLPNNDFVHVEQYLHMFNRVSVRYLTILAGFLPFLGAFAACFQGMGNITW